MNKGLLLTRYAIMTHHQDRLMEYRDHRAVTRCFNCDGIDKGYVYIPVLGNIYVCSRCKRGWTNWGLQMFKEMIE